MKINDKEKEQMRKAAVLAATTPAGDEFWAEVERRVEAKPGAELIKPRKLKLNR